jgi:GcrA cell cycle regulator
MDSIWTPDLIAEMSRLWRDGMPTAEIGRRLGISKNAVVGKADRLGLPGRPNPVDQIKAMKSRAAKAAARALTLGCRWIEGDAKVLRRGESVYCGKPVAAACGSWCETHRARIVRPRKALP